MGKNTYLYRKLFNVDYEIAMNEIVLDFQTHLLSGRLMAETQYDRGLATMKTHHGFLSRFGHRNVKGRRSGRLVELLAITDDSNYPSVREPQHRDEMTRGARNNEQVPDEVEVTDPLGRIEHHAHRICDSTSR